MNPASVAAIAATVGSFVFAGVWWRVSRAPGWRDARWLALIAFTASLYAAGDLTSTMSVPDVVLRAGTHLSLAAGLLHGMAWMVFLAERQGRPLHLAERLYLRVIPPVAVLALVPGLFVSARVSSFDVALGVRYYTAEPTLAGVLAYLVFLTSLLTTAWLHRVPAGPSERFAFRGVVFLTILGVNDTLASAHLLATPLLVDVGFFLVVVGFGVHELGRFVQDARRFHDLSRELEARVDERSAELADAQRDLARAEKLAAIGQVAAGVAHEVNNPAAAILANLSFALKQTEQPGAVKSELRTALLEARLSTERIAQIVRQLLAAGRLAGGAEVPTVPCNVAAIVGQARATALATAGDDATVQVSIAEDLMVLTDPGLLEQVLLNLIVNGIQAASMGEGAGRVLLTAQRLGNEVHLAVRDDGPGVPPEVQPFIFEPFFSTKELGTGTGLGLAVSLGLMRSLGGALVLADGSPGQTTFVVRMPATDAPPRSAPPVPTLPPDTPHTGVRLLVVDDERTVREGLRRLMSSHFDVETVSTVRAALERLERAPAPDAILCDVIMPDGGGRRLAELLAEHPGGWLARTVFITGGAVGDETKAWIDTVPQRVLYKPVRAEVLREAILEVVTTAGVSPPLGAPS